MGQFPVTNIEDSALEQGRNLLSPFQPVRSKSTLTFNTVNNWHNIFGLIKDTGSVPTSLQAIVADL